jgi:hypothetical protein
VKTPSELLQAPPPEKLMTGRLLKGYCFMCKLDSDSERWFASRDFIAGNITTLVFLTGTRP